MSLIGRVVVVCVYGFSKRQKDLLPSSGGECLAGLKALKGYACCRGGAEFLGWFESSEGLRVLQRGVGVYGWV